MTEPALDPPTAYVWLAPDMTLGAASAVEHARIARWAGARHVTLAVPAATSALPPPDQKIADDVESALTKARDALTALDAPAIEAALERASALLREHPELPQAAWLRAEVERAWASRFARVDPKDPKRAAQAWRNASALDDGRVAGIGEVASGDAPTVAATITLPTPAGLTLMLDGRPARPGPGSWREGDHQATLLREGRLAWAGWIHIGSGEEVVLPRIAATACSRDDFAALAPGGAKPHRDRRGNLIFRGAGIRCERWFVARTSGLEAPHDLAIAQCRGDACGAFVPVVDENAWAREIPAHPQEDRTRSAPAWLTWTAVGVGALLTAGAFVYATGAFDKPPHETRFVTGGVRTE